MTCVSDLENLLEPLIASLGYELWGIEYLTQKKNSILRLYIDSAHGIKLHDCERVSREVSAQLDVEDPISGFYNLEVSSPGIPRPLFKPSHFMRYEGAPVQLKLRTPIAGKRNLNGVIISSHEDSILIDVDHEQIMIHYAQILKAYIAE